eukprot:m.17947 g.17947  ORF g.17947 m.17947 type:complete len:337 (-) comp10723_c0_seq2:23-1033(-)
MAASDALQPASLFDLLSTFQLEQLEGAVIRLLWQGIIRSYPRLRPYTNTSPIVRTLLNLLWVAIKQTTLASWWYDLTLKHKYKASGAWWLRFALVYALREGLRWVAAAQRLHPTVLVERLVPTTILDNIWAWIPSWQQLDIAVDAFDVVATLLAGLQLTQQPSLVHWLSRVILGRPSARQAALKLSQQRLTDVQMQTYRDQFNGVRGLLYDAGTAILDVRKLVVPVVSLLIMLADEPTDVSTASTSTTVLPAPTSVEPTSTTFQPDKLQSCQHVVLDPLLDDACPLCGNQLQTPACLPTAGVVCCMACLQSRLQTQPLCPFTRVPVSPEAIIRLRE